MNLPTSVLPTQPRKGFFKHDWDDSNLKKWLEKAKIFQDAHINDNGSTQAFSYERNQPNEILLRLCILNYGFKSEKISLLENYNKNEKNAMKPLRQKIFKNCEGEVKIQFNIVYVSVGYQQDDGTFGNSEQPLVTFNNNSKFMDISGRIYKDFNDYLDNNELQRGVMLFPRNGTYIVDANEKSLQLEVQETPSCNFTNYVVKGLQIVVMVAGTVVTVASLFTPLVAYTGPMLAQYATMVGVTGSFWGTALMYGSKAVAVTQKLLQYQRVVQAIQILQTTATIGGAVMTTFGLIDKVSHDESVKTEILILTTLVFSQISSRVSNRIANNVRTAILDGKTLDQISQTYTKLQRALIILMNLMPKITSCASLCSAFINLWSNPNRSLQDYSQFCISMFFFANVIMKPVTLAQVFETTQGQIETEIANKITDPASQERFKKDLTDNIDPQKRAYLIKNVYRINDVDGYYQRMDRYSNTVEYTKDAFILDQNMPLSPEAYNALGKLEIINQKLAAIIKMPEGKRGEEVDRLLKDYDCIELKDKVDNLVKGQMNDQQKAQLQESLSELDNKRKDQLFKTSADYKHENGSYRDVTRNVERELCHGRTLEEWHDAKKALENNKAQMTPDEYEQTKGEIEKNVKNAEDVRSARKALDVRLLKEEISEPNTAKQKYLNEFMKNSSEAETNSTDELYDRLKESVDANAGDYAKAEREVNDKTLEEWRKEKNIVERGNAPEKEALMQKCEEGIKQAEKLREMQGFVKRDNAVTLLNENGIDNFEELQRQKCGGKIFQELKAELEDLEKIQSSMPKAEYKANEATIKHNLREAEIMEKAKIIANENNFQNKIQEQGGNNFLSQTQEFISKSETFNNQERITTVLDANLIKSNIEESFKTSNYRNVEVNGIKLFENMNDMQLTKFSGYFQDVDSAKNMVSASMALINDNSCVWKGSDAHDFGDGMKLLNEFVKPTIYPVGLIWNDIKGFLFQKCRDYGATIEELSMLHKFINIINGLPELKKAMASLEKSDMVWCVYDQCKEHLDYLANAKKDNKAEDEEEKKKSENPPKEKKKKFEKSEEQIKFSDFLKILQTFTKLLKENLIFLYEASNADKNIPLRFGEFPDFLASDGGIFSALKSNVKGVFSSNKEATSSAGQYLLRLYFTALELLTFNRHLYNCNELVLIDEGKLVQNKVYVDDGDDINFDKFIQRFVSRPIDLTSSHCEAQMKNQGEVSSAVQYMMSYIQNESIIIYIENGYQRIEINKKFHSKASKQKAFWCHEKQIYEIENDENFLEFIEAQKALIHHYQKNNVMEMLIYKDDQALAGFFPIELHENVLQWIEDYLAVVNFPILLKLLFTNFYVDGCHMSLLEFQFILSSFSFLHTHCRANLEFLQFLLSSVSQKDMVDVMLFSRLCYHQECRLNLESKIYSGIKLIDNPRHKILLAIKIHEHKKQIKNDALYKIILMLQHASSGSEQLENMNMSMWIDIALKQTWSEITSKLKQFGPAGYYLGVLDSNGRNHEEVKLRQIMESVNFIPETFIGKVTSAIVNNEIEDAERYLNGVSEFLHAGDDWTGIRRKGEEKTILVTTELDQKNLLNHITSKTGISSEFDLTKKRSIDDLRRLIVGQHDITDEEKKARIKLVNEYCDYLNCIEEGKIPQNASSNIKKTLELLIKFDEKLKKLCGKTLRVTQKMAVLCAVLSDIPILEQVNTGEGKSFIIAAIAVIRCIRDRKSVDVITSSSVLAQRDSETMQELYEKFDLTVGHNCSESIENRKAAYQRNIVYGDIAQFQRDYLMQTFYKKTILGERTRQVVIVDEVDNMLLDNGNNILYLSHNVPGMNLLDSLMIYIQKVIRLPIFNGIKSNMETLQEQFSSDCIEEQVLTELFGRYTLEDLIESDMTKNKKQCQEIYEHMVKNSILDPDGYLLIQDSTKILDLSKMISIKNKTLANRISNSLKIILNRKREIELPKYLHDFVKLHLKELIENCKRSSFMDVDYDYVVDLDKTETATSTEPKVTIIDGNTGADLPSSQWNGGLHQFLQLKHGCRLAPLSLKAVFVSNVAYLKAYKTINGLSGTLGSHHESKTLKELYSADLIKIPTFVPKKFHENAPIIATTTSKWIQAIYDEIRDQIEACRSLLVICESIAQAKIIQKGLMELLKNDGDASGLLKNCFETITMYIRSGGTFKFEEEGHELGLCKLIVATNLAGRGTDIKLSNELIDTKGLHVITAFMPKNTRIEEQAFGRAARSGQPGSAQIIAMRQEEEGIQPSIFQLKTFRDNAEIQRLAALKVYYDYHTKIEEECLEKFRNHCDKVLSSIYSNSTSSDDGKIQNPQQVVYFALLDKWAMWLDEKAPLIEKCSKNNTPEERESEKEAIINSVEEFLKDHSIVVEEAEKNWLDFPQSQITLALYHLCNKNIKKATTLLDKIISDGTEFAAEAFYFKACMKIPSTENSRELSVEEAEVVFEYFHKARVLFQRRLDRRQQEATVVAQMLKESSINEVKTCGFEEQHKSTLQYLNLIIANIDWIIGSPCDEKTFMHNKISDSSSANIYHTLGLTGIISPHLIFDKNLESWQLDALKKKYKLSKKSIEKILEKVKNDSRTPKFDNKFVAEQIVFEDHVKLSNRLNFFHELMDRRVLCQVQNVVYIEPPYVNEIKEHFEKAGIKPISKPKWDPKNPLHLISLNGSSNDREFYPRDSINQGLINAEMVSRLKDDIVAIINIHVLKDFTYFTSFDGITIEDLSDYFEISLEAGAWILQSLEDVESLKRQTVMRCKFTIDDQLWQSKIGIYFDGSSEPKEKNETLEKHALTLNELRKVPDLQNVTPKLIQVACKSKINNNKENSEKGSEIEEVDIFEILKKEKLIEYYYKTNFRIFTKLDCSILPACIRYEVDEFLTDRFAYAFALENLCISLDEQNPKTEIKIFLPENPYANFFKDLFNLGIITPPRLNIHGRDEIDEDEFEGDFDTIHEIILDKKTKLYDQTQYHLSMIPFEKYLKDQNQLIDSELKPIMDNGMKAVMSKAEKSIGFELLSETVGVVTDAAKAIWSGVKSVGNWFYSIGSSVGGWISDNIINPVADFVNAAAAKVKQGYREVKKAVAKVANIIAESEAFKAVASCTKAVANAVADGVGSAINAVGEMAYAVGDVTGINAGVRAIANVAIATGETIKSAANAVSEKASQLWESAKEVASDACDYISSTKLFQMAKNAAQTVAAVARSAYKKMSAFCTALFESYEYYNQCRSYSRKIAMESNSGVDEHTILRCYNNAREKQNETESSDKAFEEKLIRHLTQNLEKTLFEIKNLIYRVLKANLVIDDPNGCSKSLIDSFIVSGKSVKRFKALVYEKFLVESTKTKIIFYYLISTFVDHNSPLGSMAMPNLDLSLNLTELEGMLKILCLELINLAEDDEGFDESDSSGVEDENDDYLDLNQISLELSKALNSAIHDAAFNIFVSSTSQCLLTFLTAIRFPTGQSEVMAAFDKEDIELKRALVEYNVSIQEKKDNNFLLKEMVSCLHEQSKTNLNALKAAIKHGYPLPVESLEMIREAVEKAMSKNKPWKVKIKIHEDPNHPPSHINQSEMTMNLQQINGCIYVCQADYMKYENMGEVMGENINDAFLYEDIASKYKYFKSIFPMESISFRDTLISHLDSKVEAKK